MEETNTPSAVLTGDLIGSTKATERDVARAMDCLRSTAAEISHWQSSTFDTRFTRFRGDGWQIVIADHWLALRAALVLGACLRADPSLLATRIAIGIGPVDDLGTKDLADASGAAFVRSGQALDSLGKTHNLVIGGQGITPLHTAMIGLLEERMSRWTPQQAAAMVRWLHPDKPTLAEIGRQLGITPQAVNYRVVAAGGSAIRKTMNLWEEELETGPEKAYPAATGNQPP